MRATFRTAPQPHERVVDMRNNVKADRERLGPCLCAYNAMEAWLQEPLGGMGVGLGVFSNFCRPKNTHPWTAARPV